VRIDHAVYAVRDLDEAARKLLEGYGLESVPGGHHPQWGTANRIAPLGRDYVELISVVDAQAAGASHLGRTLMALTADGDRWFSVCLADPDIERTAARLGLQVEPGSRTRPDGSVVSWRGAGIDAPSRPPWLPFFIDWQVSAELHPGRSAAPAHPCGASGIAWAEVCGDAAELDAWLDGAQAPLRVVDGPKRGLSAVGLSTPAGELTLRFP
jgi:Glyoxalase-like domain